MDTISSAKFRVTYHRLEDETEVTVNGHAIGVWKPYTFAQRVVRNSTMTAEEAIEGFGALGRAMAEPSAQSKRDAILRRINKGG